MSAIAETPSRAPLLERRYAAAFFLVTLLFFSWALAAQLNDVLIRQFQKALDLSRGQAGFIQTAFYGGYFFGAIPAALFMQRFGFKKGILAGLTLYCIGALLFYPAAEVRMYFVFLGALYTIAFGLSFLETAANPYVSVMGAQETGPARLNLAQSFYGMGAFLGPFLGSLFIFSGVEYSASELAALSLAELEAYRISEAKAVQIPYLVLAGAVAVLAFVIARAKFPAVDEDTGPAAKGGFRALLKKRHLVLGVVTQFFYVGAQVAVWSFFIDFAIDVVPDMTERSAAQILSVGFIALLVGRFSGAFIMQHIAPQRILSLYAVIATGLCLVAMFAGGWLALGALWLTTFFMSIMFPTIFTLGIKGVGPLTKLASSAMIMAIIGGAIFPPMMGYVADASGIQAALVVPIVGFVVVLMYGMWGHAPMTTRDGASSAPNPP